MSEGTTPSERYLHKLAQRSFLSLWSYANPYTDKDMQRNGFGRELCDLLVVFGNDVLLFSDKYIKISSNTSVEVAWPRWFRKAVIASARQILGAEKRLRKFPEQVFRDGTCTTRLPIDIPKQNDLRIHRICVSLGAYDACEKFFGGNSIGSLLVNTSITGPDEHCTPFTVGDVFPDKGFIHVFDDFTLDAIFSELDTVTDFIEYLVKRERLFRHQPPAVMSPGEEQLLSIYLTNIDEDGEHNFVFPGAGDGEEIPDLITLDESFWDGMHSNPKYLAKKTADSISYLWDQLVERFVNEAKASERELESALRHMAAEPRIRRRQLSQSLAHFMKNAPPKTGARRVVYSRDFPVRAYVFLALPKPEGKTYDQYREHRINTLRNLCEIARLWCRNSQFMIGFAFEPNGAHGSSEDLVVLDVADWNEDRAEAAKDLQRKTGLLLDANVIMREGRTSEYPDVETPRRTPRKPAQKKNKQRAAKLRKNKRKIQKQSRNKNRLSR